MLRRWMIMGILAVLAAACTTFEVMIEKPAEPDLDAVSTLANLMLEGTQFAQILVDRGITPEPAPTIPVTGQIGGDVCYPGSTTPSITTYFFNTNTGELIEFQVDEYQKEYLVELLPGEYFVYAWAPQYLVGGLYSQKVLCGDSPECLDHSPVPVNLEAGVKKEGIDLCDWGLPAESLPLPMGSQLPGSGGTSPLE
jgi:hypothetical protein